MASLYKKPVTITDPKTGKRVKAKSKKWWRRYRVVDGREKRVPLAADKTAAPAMLNDLVRQVEREVAGIADPFEKHRKRRLADHVADWKTYLLNKGNTEKHVGEVVTKVERIAESCGWKVISDLSASDVVQCLADIRAGGMDRFSEGRDWKPDNGIVCPRCRPANRHGCCRLQQAATRGRTGTPP